MDSVQKDYLSVLKLFLLASENRNSSPTIVETYTFVLQSIAGSVPSITLVGTNQDFRVDDLQKSFTKSINSLLRSIRDFPALPRHGRRLGVSLLFREFCPMSYQPNGFSASTNRRSSIWDDESESLWITKFNVGAVTIWTSVQRTEEPSDAERRFSTVLNDFWHTSSRDPGLLPTMDFPLSSSKRKRSVADQGNQHSRLRKHPVVTDATEISVQNISVEEDTVSAGQSVAEAPCKTSDSRTVVEFSSQSSYPNVSSGCDNEAFR